MSGGHDPETLERLRLAVLALAPMQRAVYLMAARDDLSYPEIGRRLSISQDEVREHLTEALVALYDAIYGDEDDTS